MPEVPTLLIGLGGTGSEIVNLVAGRMKPEDRKLSHLIAIDTEVQALSRLTNLPEDSRLQMSEDITAGAYLDLFPAARAWFPDSALVHHKSMIHGAGQIRATSRLVLERAIRTSRLHALGVKIDSLRAINPRTANAGYRVMIVTSLTGGTGSGMFLQTAMYIRDLFRERGVGKVLIRGVFLMPDIFLGHVPAPQLPNLKANAYASLMELNTFTAAACGTRTTTAPLKLEYGPERFMGDRHEDTLVDNTRVPYDFCFVYDRETDENQILPSLKSYKDMVARCVFAQLASPIADGLYAVEDNQIIQLVEGGGTNRFCGAAVSSLEYPYEDIIHYLALRYIAENLDESWLKLDSQYEQRVKEYEQALRRGDVCTRPDRGQTYILNFDQEISSQSADSLFRLMAGQVVKKISDTSPARSKAQLFLTNVERYIKDEIDRDPLLKYLREQCSMDFEKLAMAGKGRAEIDEMERKLRVYLEGVKDKFPSYANSLSSKILLEDVDVQNSKGFTGAVSRLNTWILGMDSPVHPIAARYLLYKIRADIEQRLVRLTKTNEESRKTLEDYCVSFLSPEGTPCTAAEVYDRAKASFMRHKLKSFVRRYSSACESHKSLIERYTVEKLTEMVLTSMLAKLKRLTAEFEGFFEGLKDHSRNLRTEIEVQAALHEDGRDLTTVYALGQRRYKERLWEQIRVHVGGADSYSPEISQSLYLALYSQSVHSLTYARYQRKSVRELFDEHVVAHVRKVIENKVDVLNMTVLEALRKQAEYDGVPPSGEHLYLRAKLRELDQRARPYAPRVGDAAEFTCWGFHPGLLTKRSDTEIEELFPGERASSSRYTEREIVRYRGYSGLTADQFPKFRARREGTIMHCPDGDYYSNYKQRIAKLADPTAAGVAARAITPHLDKHWHLPQYMQDINEHVQQQQGTNILRAYVQGLCYGNFLHSGSQWFYKDKPIASGGLDNLLQGLSNHGGTVAEIVERSKKRHDAEILEKHDLSLAEHDYIRSLFSPLLKSIEGGNVIDLLVRYYEEANKAIFERRRYIALVKNTLEDILRYCRRAKDSSEVPSQGATLGMEIINSLYAHSNMNASSRQSAAREIIGGCIQELKESPLFRDPC